MQAVAVVAPDLKAGRLTRVLPTWQGPVRPMHLLFSAARPLTPKLRCFIDVVVDELGPGST